MHRIKQTIIPVLLGLISKMQSDEIALVKHGTDGLGTAVMAERLVILGEEDTMYCSLR